ncbi:NifB/NifX family molybdenum-iron cluster-binding protein [Thermohalobacter berrensis]|uniref:Diguanylate cyclase n=1 Tax=Thermohalobacter berrensis TaxID=99594 RepID=A0A419T9V4_9FIRM|nr:NifB/NifX family molybdenum-iron cluster-binding protein [Thermohalobacter berrensis]RKD34260.1 diguanylate cyclase [Thermohalobacter berrensis]
MKICLSSTGKGIESKLDIRFGRCQYFVIVDTETNEAKAIYNKGADSPQGAGVTAADTVLEQGVDVVITGNVGPNAMKLLSKGDIEIYKGTENSLKDNIEKFKEKSLNKITKSVKAHSGLKNRWDR